MQKDLYAAILVALTLIGSGCSGSSPQASLLPPSSASSVAIGKSNQHAAIVGVANATNIYISSVSDVGTNEILVYSAGKAAYSYVVKMPPDYHASGGEFAVAKDDTSADLDVYYANAVAGTLDVCVAGPAKIVVKGGALVANCAIKGVIENSAILQSSGTVDVAWNGQNGTVDVLNPAAGMVAQFSTAAFSNQAEYPPMLYYQLEAGALKMAVMPGANGNITVADATSGFYILLDGHTFALSPESLRLPADGAPGGAVAFDINASDQTWYGDSTGTLFASNASGFVLTVPNAINAAHAYTVGLATDDTYAYLYDPVAGTVTYYKDGALLPSQAVSGTMSVPAWSGPGAITIL